MNPLTEHAGWKSVDRRFHNQRKDTAVNLLFFFALAETLFIPRQGILYHVPLHIYLIWLFVFLGLVRVRLVLPTIILSCAVVIAMFRGMEVKTSPQLIEDLKRAAQLLSYAAYWLVFSRRTLRVQFGSKAQVICYSLWAILLYLSFKEVLGGGLDLTQFYPEMLRSLEVNRGAGRFPLIFEDPNSAGYFFVFVFAGICISPAPLMKKTIICLALGLGIYLTGSRGAIVAFVIVLAHWIIREITRKDIRQWGKIFVILTLSMIAIFPTAFERVSAQFEKRNESEREAGLEFGATRPEKYRSWIESEDFMSPFGRGYVWLIDDVSVRPHSDLIRIQLAYGLVGLICLLLIFFPKNFSQLILVSAAVVPVLINTLIDDYRLMGIFSLLYFLAQNNKIAGPAR